MGMKKILFWVISILLFMVLQFIILSANQTIYILIMIDILVIMGLFLASLYLSHQSLKKEIRRIIFHSVEKREKILTEEMIEGLPLPVKRYLRFTGAVGTVIPERVYLRQKGRIRKSTATPWMEITAEEYYSMEPPAFIWIGTVNKGGIPVIQVRDKYAQGKGSIQIRPGTVFPLTPVRGERMDQGSLMRYLNEMVFWFPSALLRENITFETIDENTAKIHFTDSGKTVSGTLYFDREGKLVNFRAERFEMNRNRMEIWETPISAYDKFLGLTLTRKGSGVWKYKEGDLNYIEIELTHLSYQPDSM